MFKKLKLWWYGRKKVPVCQGTNDTNYYVWDEFKQHAVVVRDNDEHIAEVFAKNFYKEPANDQKI